MPVRTERQRASPAHGCGMEGMQRLCGADSLADAGLHVYPREMKTVVCEPGHKRS